MPELAQGTKCSACNTPLSREGESVGLCPGCLLELALDDTSFEAEVLEDPEEAPTLQYSGYTFEEGQIQGERYRVRSLLGRGGMGEVWRAYDLKLRQDVALKALRTELIEDTDALETLRQEVRTAREVISPNVCRVFDLQELDGQELVSMEYVDGTTLQEILKERSPLELDEAREIASQFLAGLEAIHDAGLIHRDIKPENVMVTRTGRVVVMDFGIAKGLGDGKGGLIAGTPAYMSPEQAKGEELDARSDVFSAGVVLVEMVAPGGSRSIEDRQRIWDAIHQEAPEIADTPWSRVISRCVEGGRDSRYETAAELARALEEVTLRAVGDDTARPYPGLSAFQEEDTEYFYGRELEVEALWKKLRRPHLLALVGPSGAGKSSFLRAGLLPTLTDGWRAFVATPGDRPFSNLVQALGPQLGDAPDVTDMLQRFEEPEIAIELCSQWRQRSKHSLIILDQFEELFTQNPEAVQASFAELLGRLPLEADLFVLLSMRDDFLLHCHRFEAFQPILTDLTLLGPPIGAALRRALVEPALRCGYRFEEEAIVEEMLSEVEGQRGALPLLAFAAAQLWERRDRESGLLTRKSYEQIGGVSGALAQHAEAILDYIGETNISIVRELFRNLVTAQGTRAARDREELLSVFTGTSSSDVGAGLAPARGDETTEVPQPRAPARGAPTSTREDAAGVLSSLIDARLLTSYEVPADEEGREAHHRIEIVHESLLARWPRLVRWQRQDADSAQMRDELRNQSRLWNEHGRSEDYLWTGTAFKEYELWRERYPGGLTEIEETFAKAMTTLAERRKRWRRVAIGAVLILAIAIATAMGVLWRQSEAARQQAEAETLRAEAGKLIALGEVELISFPTASLAWATKSLELADTLEGRMLALKALQKGPPMTALGSLEPEDTWPAWRLAFSPSGDWLASSSPDEVWLRYQEGGSSAPVGDFERRTVSPISIAFGAEDLLVTDQDGEIRSWSVHTLREIRQAESNRGRLHLPLEDGYFSFSETQERDSLRWWPFDGGTSRLLGRIGTAFTSSREEKPIYQAYTNVVVDATNSLMAYSLGKAVYLRSLEDLDQPPRQLGEHPAKVVGLDLHPRGDRIAAIDEAAGIRIWGITGPPAKPLQTIRADAVYFISFEPTGKWLAGHEVVDGRPTVRLWDMTAPQGVDPLTAQRTDMIWSHQVAFHPSKPWLLTAHGDGAGFWPLSGSYPWILRGHEGAVMSVAFTPDGDWLISAAHDGVRAWPLRGQNNGASRFLLDREIGFGPFLDLQPSGEHLAVGAMDGTIFIVPLEGGPVRELGESDSSLNGLFVAFSPDGRTLASVPARAPAKKMIVRTWDLASGTSRIVGLVRGESAYLDFVEEAGLVWTGNSVYAEDQKGGGERVFDLETGEVGVLTDEGLEAARSVSGNGAFVVTVEFEVGSDKTSLAWRSCETGETRPIATHGDEVAGVAIDPSDQWMVTGSWDSVVRVGPTSNEEPHLLFGHRGLVASVAVSADGQRIASGGTDGTVRLWPTPNLSRPPIHTLPHDELMAKLRTLTNLRIIEDPEASSGWKIDYGPFPGWKEVPEW